MTDFVLIDPALNKTFLRMFKNNSIENKVVFSTSSSFWKDLDGLITLLGLPLSKIHFFINFGPGSYTGLKQSKVLAEVFSSAGAQVRIFKQEEILKVQKFCKKFFCTPAYKNQYYFALKNEDNTIDYKLISSDEWYEWLKLNKHFYRELILIENTIASLEKIAVLSDFYSIISYDELTTLSQAYEKQEIFYYRAITDDYKISFLS